ncbi:TMEM165/GDT1 family protein [Streptomyces halstedii]|uniref:TMEM165/GDT1 family protein n=1 Tax=Streptomyces TaxID=1883 RepID=UPI00048C4C2A|nr:MULTISPECIES: TMEM165/GDT1 family protein [unclassified Streptomyces]MYR73179.1 TMEM165/GDT1 family protein [Streptomyces sp. SID4925]MYY17017.1 TMEM165/GDT1 family protein [Streptomyces sp. SID4912]SBU92905.1 Putative Ca2+/H+ antiporter, TMEM165/GDT1 family [Streptomyces sp. OspMP-M45]SCD50080.1 Putative Ca2+/H+ antiporter, TMEM165/GDT1 family [Streptomyces sp. DpondAA-D4]SCE10041.1 Putative Ca2+/H+ antiporter, TMEM165/GDT1 family [Streptomyces sp. PpalLS-921]
MHLDLLAIVTAFGLIFLAELPDKTMFASLAMGTRMRPLYVWFGTSSAFIVHVAIAVGAGGLIGLLPDWIVRLVSAVLFGFGAFMLLRGSGGDDEDEEGEIKTVTGFWPVYSTAFMAVFISEWGDLTQITTANLAASNGAWSTAIGAAVALMSVSALALLAGRFIAKRVPLKTVQRIGGLCMLGLAIWSVTEIFVG